MVDEKKRKVNVKMEESGKTEQFDLPKISMRCDEIESHDGK